MPVKGKSIIRGHLVATRQQAAELVNFAAREHLTNAKLVTPVDTERLRKSERIAFTATPAHPVSSVQCGNIEVDGEFVDYHRFVNYGHATVNGGHVPGVFFWEFGEEAGRKAMRDGIKASPAKDPNVKSRKAFVQTEIGEIGYDPNGE